MSIRFAESPTTGMSIIGTHSPVPGAAAYRAIARELLDLPIGEELLAKAGWDAHHRRTVLGEAEAPVPHG
jgi:hypothetical protein